MTETAAPQNRLEARRARHRRRNFLMICGSVLVHVVIVALLPGMAAPVQQPIELTIELVARKPPPPPPKPIPLAAADSDELPASSLATQESATAGNPENQPVSQPEAEMESAESAPEQPAPAVEPEQTSPPQANEPGAPSTANEATSVVIPDPIVVPAQQPDVSAQPADDPPAEPAPQLPVEEPAPPAETAPVEQPREELPQSADVEPEADVEPQPTGSGGEGTSEQPAESGQETADAEPDTDQGPVGLEPEGEPGPPPGPSAHELSLLQGYGDRAKKKIKRLARTPERAREQQLNGTVRFEFEIASDGRLLDLRIIESSHPVFDDECLEVTRVAAPFGFFPRDVTVEKWVFQMTLAFPII